MLEVTSRLSPNDADSYENGTIAIGSPENQPMPGGLATSAARGISMRLRGLSGLAILTLMATNLGVPIPGGQLALEVLLVTIGFSTAKNIAHASNNRTWCRPFWLRQIARAYPGLITLLILAIAYWQLDHGMSDAQAQSVFGVLTMSLNYMMLFGNADFGSIDHLWVISIVWQFTLAAPVLVLALRKKLPPHRRAILLIGLAACVASVRLVLLLGGSVALEMVRLNTLTRADSLLVGLGLGVMPMAVLHRRPAKRLVPIAVFGLAALVLVGPWASRPEIGLGILPIGAIAFTAVLIAADLIDTLPARVSLILRANVLQWAGLRAFSIYLWHFPLGYVLADGPLADNPHVGLILIAASLTLAAATTSYRLIELPIRDAIADVARSHQKRPVKHVAAIEPAENSAALAS